MNDALTYCLLTDVESASLALSGFNSSVVLGLDTETYWDAATKQTRLSLVQLATEAGPVSIVDVLAVGVEVLRPLLESPAIAFTAHNASFDRAVLKGAGLSPVKIVDTLRLARVALPLASHSLAAVTAHLFDIALDKSWQQSNWRRRPLAAAQLAYAALDAHLTLRVYAELRRQLTSEGRWEMEEQAATLRVPSAASGGRTAITRRKRNDLTPGPPLSAKEQRVVARLKQWRLERANQQRIPAYMICPDRTLEDLARVRPTTLNALLAVHGLGAAKVAAYGEELLQAVLEAFDSTG